MEAKGRRGVSDTTTVDLEGFFKDPVATLAKSSPIEARFLWGRLQESAAKTLQATEKLLHMIEVKGQRDIAAKSAQDIFGFHCAIPDDKVAVFWRHLLQPIVGNIASFVDPATTSPNSVGISKADRDKKRREGIRERARAMVFDTIELLEKNTYLKQCIDDHPGKSKPFKTMGCFDWLFGWSASENKKRNDRPQENVKPHEIVKILEAVENWLEEKNAKGEKITLPGLDVIKDIEMKVLAVLDGRDVVEPSQNNNSARRPRKKGIRKKLTNKQLVQHNGDPQAMMVGDFATDDAKLRAVSVAYPTVSRELEQKKCPVDMIFMEEGSKLYDALEKNDTEFTRPKVGDAFVPIKIDCRPLVSKALEKKLAKRKDKFWLVAPMVLGLLNFLSPSVSLAYARHKNRLPCCKDSHTGAGTGLMRASFYPEEGVENPLNPMVNLTSKAIESVVMDDVEKAMTNLMRRLSVKFHDKVMELLETDVEASGSGRGRGDKPSETANCSESDRESDSDCSSVGSNDRSIDSAFMGSSVTARRTTATLPTRRARKCYTRRTGKYQIKNNKVPHKKKINAKHRLFIPPPALNLMMSKIATPAVSKYEKHQDTDGLLNCPPLGHTGRLEMVNGTTKQRFPFKEEMNIITLCTAGKGYTAKTKVTWHREGKGELGFVIVQGNSAHIQSNFTQYFRIMHHSAVIPSSLKGSIGARSIDSFRETADPNRERSCYCYGARLAGVAPENFGDGKKKRKMPYNKYEWVDAMEGTATLSRAKKLPAEQAITAPHWWQDSTLWRDIPESSSNKSTDKCSKRRKTAKSSFLPKSFSTLPSSTSFAPFRKRQVYIKEKDDPKAATKRVIRGVPKIQRTIGIGQQSRKEILCRSKFTARTIGEFGRVFQFQDKDGQREAFQPVYLHADGRVIPSGHQFWFSDIPELSNNKQATQVIDKDTPNKIVLSHKYKNNLDKESFDPIDQHMRFFKEWNEYRFGTQSGVMIGHGITKRQWKPDRHKREALRKEFNRIKDLVIDIGGGGGSAQPAGQFSFSAQTHRPDDPSHICGRYQKIDNKTTRALLDCYVRGNAVAVICNHNKWDTGKSTEEKMLTLLSYYDVCDVFNEKEDIKDMLKSHDVDYLMKNLYNVSYKLFGCWKFKCKLSFDFKTLECICDMWEMDAPPEPIIVEQADKRPICAPLDAVEKFLLSKKDDARDEVLEAIANAKKAKKKKKTKNKAKTIHEAIEEEEHDEDGEGDDLLIPLPWISSEDIIDFICTAVGAEDFLAAVDSQSQVALNYFVNPDEVISGMLYLAASGAAKSDPKRSTRWRRKDNAFTCAYEEILNETSMGADHCYERYAIPLVAEFCDQFPDVLRSNWLPQANRDEDVATTSFRYNVDCLYSEMKNTHSPSQMPALKVFKGFEGSYHQPNVFQKKHAKLMLDCYYIWASLAVLQGTLRFLSFFQHGEKPSMVSLWSLVGTYPSARMGLPLSRK